MSRNPTSDQEGSPSLFCDVHCHFMTLAHPNILAFIENLRRHRRKHGLREFFSFLYAFDPFIDRPADRIRNMLAVMDNDIGSMFILLEDDLAGRFNEEVEEPLIRNGILHVGGHAYSKILLTPLIIDFGEKHLQSKKIHYRRPPSKPVWNFVQDVLAGIRKYRKERPKGLLEIYPFLGINPEEHTLLELKSLLDKHFGWYTGSHTILRETSTAMTTFKGGVSALGSNIFAGIKVYPPLGFDPWPEGNTEEMEKVEYMYAFCSKKRIPITAHCDDQGFRTVGLTRSRTYTSPERWETVLKHHSDLKLNLAHFGKQHARKHGLFRQNAWFSKILSLLSEYPHVYTDFSFNGTDPKYYGFLKKALELLPDKARSAVESKILFGSDFLVHLLKIDSYFRYLSDFGNSPLSPEQKIQFTSENPQRFLFENQTVVAKIAQWIDKTKTRWRGPSHV